MKSKIDNLKEDLNKISINYENELNQEKYSNKKSTHELMNLLSVIDGNISKDEAKKDLKISTTRIELKPTPNTTAKQPSTNLQDLKPSDTCKNFLVSAQIEENKQKQILSNMEDYIDNNVCLIRIQLSKSICIEDQRPDESMVGIKVESPSKDDILNSSRGSVRNYINGKYNSIMNGIIIN